VMRPLVNTLVMGCCLQKTEVSSSVTGLCEGLVPLFAQPVLRCCMPGTLQLSISDKRRPDTCLLLHFPKVLVEMVEDGMALRDTETDRVAVLWYAELKSVSECGGGPTALTAFMVQQLIEQKFTGPS
jgi:hypothetical protein